MNRLMLSTRRDTGNGECESPTAALMDALVDPMRPVFLFGTVPPREGTSLEAAAGARARAQSLAHTLAHVVCDAMLPARARVPLTCPFILAVLI